MRRRKNKWDFFDINQAMNQNFNGGKDFSGNDTKGITKAEEIELKRRKMRRNKDMKEGR